MAQIAHLSKLLVENDEDDDFVKFSFPNETRRIKCSITLLSQVSPVFATMFSEKWLKEKTIKMDDLVQFDQFATFKLLVDILYGLNKEDLLTVVEATNVFFYTHKYEVETVGDRIFSYISDKIDVGWLTTAEVKEVFEFTKVFGFNDLIGKLDQMELYLDGENCNEFYQLADGLHLAGLKQQIIKYGATIKPDTKWTPEFLCAVVESQHEREKILLDKIKTFEGNSIGPGSSNIV